MALIPAGFYRAKARNAELGISPEKKTQFVRVVFVLTEGEHGQELVWDGYFTKDTAKRTFESMQYCGCTFPNNDPTDFTGIDTNEVSVEVEHQTYTKRETGQEKTYARIAWVNSMVRGISPEAKMNDAQKAMFKQQMMGQLMQVRRGGTAPTANGSTAQPQAPPQPQDEIPF